MIFARRISFWTLFLAAMVVKGWAQSLPPEAHFNRYTSQDGLPDNNIISLVQDDRGFIWIGTEAGLSCFDGVHFTNYFKGKDLRNSLPSNYIVKLLKLPNGKIAIATRFGLSLLDPVDRTFKSRLVPYEPGMEFALNTLGTLVRTSQGEIVAGSNAGICVFDTALNVRFQYVHFKKEDLEKNAAGFAQDLMPLDNGDVLIRGWNGFWRFNAPELRVEKQDAQAFGELVWETFNSAGNNHIAIWRTGFPDSLSMHNLRTGQIHITKLSDEIKYEFHWRTVFHFVNDTLLGFAGCNHGFRTAICDPATMQLRFSERRIFPDQHINAFLFDREGRWWLASENGLLGQSFTKGFFRMVQLNPGTGADNIPYITSGITKADGRFYIGLLTKIWVLDEGLQFLKSIDFPIEYVHVWGLTQWQPGILEVWSNSGWKRLPIQKNWDAPPAWRPTGPVLATRSQLMDSRGDIWTGTETGVLRYQSAPEQETHFGGGWLEGKFPRQGALKIIETDSGYLWMCGLPGFTRWNPFTQSFDRHFKQAPGMEQQEGYPSAMVSNGGEEMLFALYGNGLWRWWGDERPAESVLNENPVFGFVNDIFPDPRPHHFWLLLKSGIALLDVSTGKYRYLTHQEGLPDKTIKTDFYLDRQTDSIYICYENSIVVSHRNNFDFSDKSVPVYITSIQQLSTSLMLDIGASLKFEQPNQDIAIAFSSPDFEQGASLDYAYRLNDGVWVSLGDSKSVRFVNLSPGAYRFEVKSITPEGVSSEPAVLDFWVKPLFWQTWWFVAIIVAGFGLGVFGYFRWQLEQLRKLEAMRQAIAADLHDEVGASLTSIQILAQLANHDDPIRRAEALNKLPEQVRQTSASLREIVWNINPKDNALSLLLSELTRYAGEVFEKMDIQYTVQADDFPKEAILETVARQHLLRIFKEALNNITKHSQANRAAVFFKKENHALVLLLRDNGQGFDPQTVQRGNGLNNMQQRAAAAGGQLTLNSSPTEGTEIMLRIPLRLKRGWRQFLQN